MTLPTPFYGSEREEPAPGRFVLRLGPHDGYICDPAAPLKQGDMVAYLIHDGSYLIGRLETKHPDKAKTLNIITHGLPSGRIPCEDAAKCVQIFRDI